MRITEGRRIGDKTSPNKRFNQLVLIHASTDNVIVCIRRTFSSTDGFVKDFFETARPGAIPDDEFLGVNGIKAGLETQGFNQRSPLDILDELPTDESDFVEALTDEIAKHSAPEKLIQTCFLLVGHSSKKEIYVSEDSIITIADDAAKASGNPQKAREIAETLREIGLHDVLRSAGDARTVALGVQIGLETDARKGRGGTFYEKAVKRTLKPIVENLKSEGYEIWLDTQYTTGYKPENKDQEKTVDFAILHGDELLVAFESNCYTTGGSKVSSTEREYDDLSTKMRSNGVEFVWITDGYGWEWKESSTLREAYEDVRDIYNLDMVERTLESDLREHFGDNLKTGSKNTLAGY